MAKRFDIITIGSGGGAKVSTPAHKLGFKVAMIEKGFDVFGEHKSGLGGTCLNRGCIPSKMLIHPADLATEISEANKYFMEASVTSFDFEKLVQRTSASVDGDSASINPAYEKDPNKVLYPVKAKFVGPKTLQVGDETITADHIFIAAGCFPSVPPIPGLKDTPYITSTEALRLPKQPKKMIVLGGGYIGVELGHFYGALGTEVHFMVRSIMLRPEDRETAEEFTRVFKERYHCHFGVGFTSVSHSPETGFTLKYTDKDGAEKEMQADELLVTTGVTPATADLDLDKTGVEVTKQGFIKVDECLRTTAEGIYAFGDIAGNYLFRHSANFEGEYLLEHVIHPLAAKQPINMPPIDYTGMPHAVFSYPQVAGVGDTEEQIQAKGIDYVKGVANYRNSAMGDARQSDHGFAKVLIEKSTRRILGAFIVGYEASTMIHQVIPLMRLQGKLDDLLLMVHIHPALNEILRNAARKAGQALVAAGAEVPLAVRIKS